MLDARPAVLFDGPGKEHSRELIIGHIPDAVNIPSNYLGGYYRTLFPVDNFLENFKVAVIQLSLLK